MIKEAWVGLITSPICDLHADLTVRLLRLPLQAQGESAEGLVEGSSASRFDDQVMDQVKLTPRMTAASGRTHEVARQPKEGVRGLQR